MFDCNDQDQVGDTIWGDFGKSEDLIVPYPKDTEENSLCSFGNCKKKQRAEEAGTVARSVGQTSGAKNDFAECNLENNSGFTRNVELFDMDIWPELPSLNSTLNKGYNHENDRDSLETGLLNTFTGASNVNKTRVQLDGAPEVFGNEHEDKESDNFLDCDWANFGDFDDLDRIFRNSDSIFYHEMVGTADEFMSPSTDVIGDTAQSIPMPNAEHSGGKRNPEEKTADFSVTTQEQILCQTHLTGEYRGTINQSTEKVDGQKKLLRSRKKAEERNENKASQSFDSARSHNLNQTLQATTPKVHASLTTPPQTFQSPAISQQRQFGVESIGHPSPSSQLMLSGYGYSMYTHPAIPQMPLVHAEGYKYYPDPVKHSETLDKLPYVSKQSTMTVQEKIEKLRRRHKMQAMLAIQQQRQQFGQKSQSQDAVAGTVAVEENAYKSTSSELNMLEQDEFQSFFLMIGDSSLVETMFSQLQDALGKLDIEVRLCIRDSLFRLAKSVMERQC